MLHERAILTSLSVSLVLLIACGGGDDSHKGGAGSGGGDDAGAKKDSGTEPKDDGGLDAGNADASVDAGGGGGGQGGSAGGGSTEPSCKERKGAGTWTVIDPKLTDFAVTRDELRGKPGTAGLAGVAFGNGMFVALGQTSGEDSYRWATSSDGSKWTAHSSKLASGTISTISRIHFANDQFVFFAEHFGDGFFVYSSKDADTWKETRILMNDRAIVSEFAASDSTFVYAGHFADLRSSKDLKKWTPFADVAGMFFDFLDIAYGDGRFIASTNGGPDLWTSTDGLAWKKTSISGLSSPQLEYGNGLWLANVAGAIQTSEDGKTFKAVTVKGHAPGSAPRFAGGRFVTITAPAADMSIISASTDAVTWIDQGAIKLPAKRPAHDAVPADDKVEQTVRDLDYGDCRYVLVGETVFSPPPPGLNEEFLQTHEPLIVVGDFSP